MMSGPACAYHVVCVGKKKLAVKEKKEPRCRMMKEGLTSAWNSAGARIPAVDVYVALLGRRPRRMLLNMKARNVFVWRQIASSGREPFMVNKGKNFTLSILTKIHAEWCLGNPNW